MVQTTLIRKGFRQGGPAGFGLRRLLVDETGSPKFELRRLEHKSIQTDRVILVPGPPEEITVVRDIYRDFVDRGLNAFLFMTLPTVDIVEIGATKIITNWPAEMVDYYDAHNLLIDSPVIRCMLRSTSPFNYDVEAVNADRWESKKSAVIDLFNRYGMGKGAYFPVHDAAGGRGAMSISGPRNF